MNWQGFLGGQFRYWDLQKIKVRCEQIKVSEQEN